MWLPTEVLWEPPKDSDWSCERFFDPIRHAEKHLRTGLTSAALPLLAASISPSSFSVTFVPERHPELLGDIDGVEAPSFVLPSRIKFGSTDNRPPTYTNPPNQKKLSPCLNNQCNHHHASTTSGTITMSQQPVETITMSQQPVETITMSQPVQPSPCLNNQ
jgi:hypothetical protein